MLIQPNDVILFQGDSVTDCGRNKEDQNGMGVGYPYLLSCWLKAMYSDYDLAIYNRGISGNRVCDLEARWQQDCIDLQPTVVSILIGINDTWRRYDQNDLTTVEDFEAGYRRIVTKAKEELGCRVVIMEPFLLHSKDGQAQWREDLDPKIQAVRRIAADLCDCFVPLDGVFAAAAMGVGNAYWLPDGVHPNEASRALIAQRWLDAVESC